MPNTITHILLVEDNPISQKLGEKVLIKAGYQVTVAANGKQAIEVLKSNTPDLVLLDIEMPIMDGFETAKVIRTQLALDVLLFATTGHNEEDIKDKCLDAGMNGVVPKPFFPKHIESALEQLKI